MINNLQGLQDLPPGEYTLSLSVFQRDGAKRIYVYAEDTSDRKNVHCIAFDEFKASFSKDKWIRNAAEPKSRPIPSKDRPKLQRPLSKEST